MQSALVLIYGESANDTHAIEHLVRNFLPPGKKVSYRKIRKPVVLARGAAAHKRVEMAKFIASVEKSEKAKYEKIVVVAHRDCDSIEPAHVQNATELENDLLKNGVSKPIAATPAWCIETWWMQFSEEVASVRSCWAKIDFGGRQVGSIINAKDELRRALRPKDKPGICKDYQESDGVRIAQKISESGKAKVPNILLSNSLEEFRAKIFKAF